MDSDHNLGWLQGELSHCHFKIYDYGFTVGYFSYEETFQENDGTYGAGRLSIDDIYNRVNSAVLDHVEGWEAQADANSGR